MITRAPTISLLALLLSGLCVANAVSASSNTDAPAEQGSVVAADGPESDLEAVHGFGVAPQNALRDDTIALWEAFKRDQVQQACMARAGFKYQPELAFPSGVAVQVADKLKLSAPQAASLDFYGSAATVENRRYSDALPAPQRDGYFQALYGESASDMDLVRSTGQLPAGRADFARGGCYGKAWKAIPGIYNLKREFVEAVRAARSSNGGNTGSAVPNPACVAESGAALNSLQDFDAALGRGEDISQAIEAGCDKQVIKMAQRARIARENQVFVTNRVVLNAHRAAYKDVMQTIARDRAFLEYLAVVADGIKRDARNIELQDHQHD